MQIRGLTYLPNWENVTDDYLHGIRLRNNLHSSLFPKSTPSLKHVAQYFKALFLVEST